MSAPKSKDRRTLKSVAKGGLRDGSNAVARPRLQGRDQRVLGEVLGELQVAGHPEQSRHDAGRLQLPDRDDGLVRGR